MNTVSKAFDTLPVIAPRPPTRFLKKRPSRSPTERRATRRLEIEIDVEERVGGCRYFRVTSDLSTFGLSTRHGYPHSVGTRVQLLLYLPDDPSRPVSLTAEVVGRAERHRGARLAFKNPSAAAVRRIHAFLRARTV